ncbi:hypothetical protein AB4Y64_13395 [Lysobacter sp. TAF61]|uniref:hypothetical protein n=1 Tax=Lysobacter sp. TAF61 TaxID=3233072 RepID=UPI003F9D868D
MSIVLVGSCVVLPVARAADKPFDTVAVMEKQDRIRLNVASGAAGFSELSADKRSELQQRQAALSQTIKGRSYADLTTEERSKASADIAWIDEVAAQAADERLVCERTKKAGTNRVERVCMTVAQRREAQQRARETLQDGGSRMSPNLGQ